MVNGLHGEQMLLGLAIGIALLIFMVLKTKIQAFLALIITTVVIGVIGGMPLNKVRYFAVHYQRIWKHPVQHRYYHRLRCNAGSNF